jgi:hypothetical protein
MIARSYLKLKVGIRKKVERCWKECMLQAAHSSRVPRNQRGKRVQYVYKEGYSFGGAGPSGIVSKI